VVLPCPPRRYPSILSSMRIGGWLASCESELTITGVGFTPPSAAASLEDQKRTPSTVSPPTPLELPSLPIALGFEGLMSMFACTCVLVFRELHGKPRFVAKCYVTMQC